MPNDNSNLAGITAALHALSRILATATADVHAALADIGRGNQNAAVSAVLFAHDALEQATPLCIAIRAMHRFPPHEDQDRQQP
jgi:hypothetical protein